MKCKSNRNVVYACNYRVVWCPKYRRPVLTGDVETRLRELIADTCASLGVEIQALEIMPDHVHLLIGVDPQLGVHRAVKRIKGRTSHDLREEFPHLRSRIPSLWTNSYFVSTMGGASLDAVRKYIEEQKSV